MMEELDKFRVIQNDCHHEFHPCVICVKRKFKLLTQDAYENCCSPIEKKIRINFEGNECHNTEIEVAKRNMRHAEKKYSQDKANELKHDEFRRLRRLKCD